MTEAKPDLPEGPIDCLEARRLRDELAAAIKRAEEATNDCRWLRITVKELRAENKKLRGELADAWQSFKAEKEARQTAKAQLALVRTSSDGVWLWQGEGDRPESLVCPVVMSAETLRKFVTDQENQTMVVEGQRGRIEQLEKREPTEEEMDRALGDADEAFLGGTVRRCIECRKPIFGGPTRCMLCVYRGELNDACDLRQAHSLAIRWACKELCINRERTENLVNLIQWSGLPAEPLVTDAPSKPIPHGALPGATCWVGRSANSRYGVALECGPRDADAITREIASWPEETPQGGKELWQLCGKCGGTRSVHEYPVPLGHAFDPASSPPSEPDITEQERIRLVMQQLEPAEEASDENEWNDEFLEELRKMHPIVDDPEQLELSIKSGALDNALDALKSKNALIRRLTAERNEAVRVAFSSNPVEARISTDFSGRVIQPGDWVDSTDLQKHPRVWPKRVASVGSMITFEDGSMEHCSGLRIVDAPKDKS